MLKITEIFTSLQGEGLDWGRPCCFVRLWGCNLDCVWCDTRYSAGGMAGRVGEETADGEGPVLMSVGQVVEQVVATGRELVCVTGGEPLLQPAARALLDGLVGAGLDVVLETNGSVFVGEVNSRVRRILDYKLGGSGCGGSFCEENWGELSLGDQLKFVVAGEDDFGEAAGLCRKHNLPVRTNVLFSPVGVGDGPRVDPGDLAEWILESGLDVRLQLQLHKLLWPLESRGR